jgi:hypothetical protein
MQTEINSPANIAKLVKANLSIPMNYRQSVSDRIRLRCEVVRRRLAMAELQATIHAEIAPALEKHNAVIYS